jgi:homopolymeric O-antigen transport system ATP-binding protein
MTVIDAQAVSKQFLLKHNASVELKVRVLGLLHRRHRESVEEFWALKNVSLRIDQGEGVGLIGRNGSGKSTFLKLIAAIHRPTSGRLLVARGVRIASMIELGVGFHPELTGRENVYLNGSILGLGRKAINAKIDDIIEFAGLGDFIDSPVKVYSSGMYVRLGFSVAVHVEPDILIIDEVIAVGDEDFQRRCFDHLYRLRTSGATIILVTHSLNLVQTMCDNAAWLDHGELKAEGKAPEVVHQYLDQVNVVEAERIGAGHDGARVESLGASSSHGLLTIDEVEFLGPDGKPTQVAEPLQPLTVRMHWSSREPVDEPLFSFAVESEAGVYVANPGMRTTPEPPKISGEGFVDYRIAELALGPGEYTFSVAAHDHSGTTVLDKRERFMTLRVQPGSHLVYGLVDMLGDWVPPVSRDGDAS